MATARREAVRCIVDFGGAFEYKSKKVALFNRDAAWKADELYGNSCRGLDSDRMVRN